MRTLYSFILMLTLVVALHQSTILASANGVTQATRRNGSSGCGCHGGTNAQIDPTVIVKIDGPDTLLINQTALYTVTISGGAAFKSGVDIAVSNGTLLTSGSTILKLTNQELTHKAPVAYSDGKVVFQFSLKAPASEDSIILYATGSSSKAWNFANDKPIKIVKQMSGIEDATVAKDFYILQNYPNPFNPRTKIRYSILKDAKVKLTVFNSSGDKIADIVNKHETSGTYEVDFSGDNRASGIYYCQLKVIADNSQYSISKVLKLVLLK